MTVMNLETELREMSERSVLFRMIKDEMQRRGHWKNRDRGSEPPIKGRFTRLNIQGDKDFQVSDNTGFSDWGI